MIKAAHNLAAAYRRITPEVAEKHGIEYPAGLERVLLERLDRLGG